MQAYLAGSEGQAPPGNVLDFNSLTSPFLGFQVNQAGYWPGFNLESVFFVLKVYL